MDMIKSAAAFMKLDALEVRNHAAFAAFACSSQFANIRKQRVSTQHWDARMPHVGFFATRDILPGEELAYYRQDEEAKRSSHEVCHCNLEGCRRRL